MKVAIPNALYTNTSNLMYKVFFENIGVKVVFSGNTTKEIKEEGIRLSIDEACLASKIFMGHVASLVKRKEKENIDYIFIPRLCSYKNSDTECVRFYAMYDICKNTFDSDFITLDIDYNNGNSEILAYIKLAKTLNVGFAKAYVAYIKALNRCKEEVYIQRKLRAKIIKNDKKKILIVSHPYVFDDAIIGQPICKYLKSQNVDLFYASKENLKEKVYKEISSTLYWKQSQELVSGTINSLKKIDGIVYLSVFPCGTDSLVTEIMQRKIKNVPSINLIVDEHSGFEGYVTRLESFLDIVNN